ncbi:MAG: universal stress protein [bacterium]
MQIKKILYPTNFREYDFHVLRSLLVLKEAGLREIVLHHVIPREEVTFVPYGGYLREEENRLREEARIKLEDWGDTIAPAGITSVIRIETGEPVPKILAAAGEENADLIVVGKRNLTGMEKFFTSSHIIDILRRSRVPVLVDEYMVQCELQGQQVTRVNDRIFEKPLLASDWSPPSQHALDLLTSLAPVVQKAAVVHVMDSKILKGMERTETLRIEKESRERLKSYCDHLKAAGIEAEHHLSAGTAVQEIITLAQRLGATMILTGTTGKDRLHELWLGSVSHRLPDLSELPVLLVP